MSETVATGTGRTSGFVAAVVLGMSAAGTPALAQQTVTLQMDGGAIQTAMRSAIFDDAEKELGLKIVIDSNSGNGLADIRAQVQSGKPAFDAMIQSDYGSPVAAAEGLYETLDYTVIDASGIPATSRTDTCIGAYEYATIVAYNSDTFTGDKTPHGWAALWDSETYPGARSLRRRPMINLEAAILADGVAPAELYSVLEGPGGVDRAFAKLGELKPDIAAWWTSGAQSVQLVSDEESTIGSTWNGTLENARSKGAPLAYNFDEAIIQYDCWAIPKGAPNAAAAQKLIAYMMRPEVQARFAITPGGYPPTNLKAYDTGIIPAEWMAASPMGPENRKKAIAFDAAWWSKNISTIEPRFTDFIQQ